jgi:IS30 family transposase
MFPFNLCCRSTAGLLRQLVGARCSRLRWQNGKTFLKGLLAARRFVSSKDTATVVAALSQHVRRLPASLRRSLNWDRGLEMAQHKSFTVDTKVKVHFCDPQSPWQPGSNENTNGLLRQYFSKRTDLSAFSQEELDEVALRLNQRPRKTLGFQTPADRLQASVASTH